MNPKILALIAGVVLLGAGVISVWIIAREGSPANVSRGKLAPASSEAASEKQESSPAKHAPSEHKQPPKAHKH